MTSLFSRVREGLARTAQQIREKLRSAEPAAVVAVRLTSGAELIARIATGPDVPFTATAKAGGLTLLGRKQPSREALRQQAPGLETPGQWIRCQREPFGAHDTQARKELVKPAAVARRDKRGNSLVGCVGIAIRIRAP